jgi:hypothetical protein
MHTTHYILSWAASTRMAPDSALSWVDDHARQARLEKNIDELASLFQELSLLVSTAPPTTVHTRARGTCMHSVLHTRTRSAGTLRACDGMARSALLCLPAAVSPPPPLRLASIQTNTLGERPRRGPGQHRVAGSDGEGLRWEGCRRASVGQSVSVISSGGGGGGGGDDTAAVTWRSYRHRTRKRLCCCVWLLVMVLLLCVGPSALRFLLRSSHESGSPQHGTVPVSSVDNDSTGDTHGGAGWG